MIIENTLILILNLAQVEIFYEHTVEHPSDDEQYLIIDPPTINYLFNASILGHNDSHYLKAVLLTILFEGMLPLVDKEEDPRVRSEVWRHFHCLDILTLVSPSVTNLSSD